MGLKLFNSFTKQKPRAMNTWMRTLVVDDEQIPVKVTENPRSTRLTLRIVPGGKSLKVTMPPHIDGKQLDEFLDRNKNWVAAKLSRLPKTVQIGEGATIPYLGVDHKIVHLDRLRGVVEAKEIAGETSLLVPGEPSHIARKLETFLKKQARERLNVAVNHYARELSVRPKSIRITDTTSRWGSCSSTRTLSFSWRIIMAPQEVLNYLAAHEVAHLREMNHSDKFWDHVRDVCPDMELQKAWLRTNGARLHAVDLS
ncbi:MAG: M48 family metallopeptidase [Nitratireductor sp.]